LLRVGRASELYRATHEFIERDVLLKTLGSEHVASAELGRRLKAEARALGSIRHPNIVTIYDAGVTKRGVPYVATQLICGNSLAHVLRSQRGISIPDALEIAGKVADGLHAAHALGIVHGDLTAEKVVLMPGNRLKLLDIGTAKLFSACAVSKPGSVPNRPLADCLGSQPRELTPSADLSALGLLLSAMLCTRPRALHDAFTHGPSRAAHASRTRHELAARFAHALLDLIRAALDGPAHGAAASTGEFAARSRELRRQILKHCQRAKLTPNDLILPNGTATRLAYFAVLARAHVGSNWPRVQRARTAEDSVRTQAPHRARRTLESA
jgi:serine/threonine-protein kinase